MPGKASDRLARKQTILAQENNLPSKYSRRSAKGPKIKFFLKFDEKTINLDKRKKYIFGRAQECEIQIKDPRVSRQHGRLKWNVNSQNFVFEDLASRNGSLINEKQVNWGNLKNGDIIDLVGNKFLFEEHILSNNKKEHLPSQTNKANMLLEQKFSNILSFVDDRHLKDRLQEYHELIVDSRKELSLLAFHDQITGLFNRRYFNISIEREIKLTKRKKNPLSLIMIDIDHFKIFNDTHGHQKGDQVLEGVAGFIRSAIRSTDIACRYGGEELAVILPDTPSDKAFKVAEKIRKKVSTLSKDQFGVPVTISLGVAAINTMQKNSSQLIKAADKALYKAKNSGRNRTISFNSE